MHVDRPELGLVHVLHHPAGDEVLEDPLAEPVAQALDPLRGGVRVVRGGLGEHQVGDRLARRGGVVDDEVPADVGDPAGQREVDQHGRGHAEVESDAGTGRLAGLVVIREEEEFLSERDGGHVRNDSGRCHLRNDQPSG
ncbi:hypothetical protein Asp14428_54860 [Actinoplanes sp. NBRC 14428]|nr:hypothetical protein Asp14428_54860 [Actinoplanes sp. NBRC 14428]